jgi:hypothetical protein
MSFDAAAVKNVTLDAASELNLRVAKPSTPPSAPSPSGPSGGPKTTPSKGGR